MTALQERRTRNSASRIKQPADHAVSVKLSVDLLTAVEALGLVDGTSPAGQIRDALGYYFDRRLKDPALEEHIAAAERRHSAALAVLRDPRLARADENTKPMRRRRTEREQAITLKISDYDSEMLSALGLLDETSLADQLRAAVGAYVDFRKTDRTLSSKIEQANAERERTLSALEQHSA